MKKEGTSHTTITKRGVHGIMVFSGAVILLLAEFAQGATQTWDTSPGTVGVGNGTITAGAGAWDTSNGNWTSDNGANNVAWNNANQDQANFSVGSSSPKLTLGCDVTAASLNANVSAHVVVSNSVGNSYVVKLVGTAGSPDVTLGNASSDITISAPVVFSTVNRTDFRTGSSITYLLGGISAVNASGNPTNITLTINVTTTLGGNSSYSGTTVISGSALSLILASDTGMGNSVLSTYSSASANFLSASGGPRTIGNDLLLANINSSKNLTIQGSYDMTFNGTVRLNTAEGAINNYLNVNAITATFNGNVLENTANEYTFNKGGSGTLVLNGTASAWRGKTSVTAGTLAFNSIADWGAANVSALGAPSSAANGIISVTGATLRYTGTGHNSNRGITITNDCTFESTGSGTLTLNGNVTGTGNLMKTGAGTWTLAGANTYGGVTTVSNGTLAINGSLSASPSNVTVVANGTLGGTGTVSRAVTVATGGTVMPGAGVLTVSSNFTFNAGAIYNGSSPAGVVSVGGALSIPSSATVDVSVVQARTLFQASPGSISAPGDLSGWVVRLNGTPSPRMFLTSDNTTVKLNLNPVGTTIRIQ